MEEIISVWSPPFYFKLKSMKVQNTIKGLFGLLLTSAIIGCSTSKDLEDITPPKEIEDFQIANPDDIKDDIKISISRGEATSYQNENSSIEKSFDGDFQTHYHSKWDNSAENYFPITLTYYFDDPQEIDYFIYTPRQDSSKNGNFKETEIHYKQSGKEFVKLLDKDFKGAATASRISFDKSLKEVTAVKFIIKSGAGDRQGFAACAEMEFFKKNNNDFDLLSLFTDTSCSELKEGIGAKEINKCSNPFFKNIANHLYQGSYPKEFRIDTFEAYPHPDVQSSTHKTNPYSLLDNATGIYVRKGDILVTLVGGTNDQDLSLCILNLDVPGGDGFNSKQIYALNEGINKIKAREKGLVYVLYHTESIEQAKAAKPINIHFATGKVNGYFNSTKHKPEKYNELINKADYKYFDLIGEYAHLTFPTIRFLDHTPNGKALIDAYDKIVQSEMELMGLFKYDKVFLNRMYFNVIYTSYMYATAYHTAYNNSTLGELCDVSKLTSSSCWGPAHEVGHCNQTRPGLKWQGTTEVTNNIMSEYIQTTVFKQPSRIQDENMGQFYINRYSKAWSSIIAAKAPHAYFSSINEENGSDVFCKLVPFWQLELYFGRVLGRTPLQQADKGGFYPDVYEMVRTNENLKGAGNQQLEFVYTASKIAGYNLLDFFTKWGFLTPVDVEIDDYGKARMQITQAQIDATIKRVEALGLPKLDIALEYISDNTWELFKSKPAIEKGIATIADNKLTMSNWKNVLTYEITDKNNNLLFICSGQNRPTNVASFKVPFDWDSSYKVHAVAVDNTRVEVILN